MCAQPRLAVSARRLGTAALCLYLALLVLAAWPSVLSPGFLRAASREAGDALLTVGIRPGQDVFGYPSDREWYPAAYCLHARGQRPGGEVVPLWPPGGKCKTAGLRWWLPPRDRAYMRMFLRAVRGFAAERPPAVAGGLLEAVGRQLCDEARRDLRPVEQVELLWYRHLRNPETGAERVEPLLRYDWDCRLRRKQDLHWHPDPAYVERSWGGLPWR
jgi:hypothetical protein